MWLTEPIAELCAEVERDIAAARLPDDAEDRLRAVILAANGGPPDVVARVALSEVLAMLAGVSRER